MTWPDPHFNQAATILTALIVVFLVAVLPWIGRRRYAALAARPARPGRLVRVYLRSAATWWPLAVLVALLPVISPGIRRADLGLVLPPAGFALARMEPTKWGSAIIAVLGIVEAILVVRLQQVWTGV